MLVSGVWRKQNDLLMKVGVIATEKTEIISKVEVTTDCITKNPC
jgi:hypothetical protein